MIYRALNPANNNPSKNDPCFTIIRRIGWEARYKMDNLQDPSDLCLRKEIYYVAADVMKDRVAEGTRYLQFDAHVGRDEVPVGYWTRFNDF